MALGQPTLDGCDKFFVFQAVFLLFIFYFPYVFLIASSVAVLVDMFYAINIYRAHAESFKHALPPVVAF